MCGISGISSKDKKIESLWIRNMSDSLKHRGPDDEGYLAIDTHRRTTTHLCGQDSTIAGLSIHHYQSYANLFLGHRRLSILDPSPAGHQPMSNKDQSLSIVFNGEIYNYIELRKELQNLGHVFQTDSDTEVLLAAYEQWDRNCLQHLDGMWAFVLYDRRKNLIFGSRDRFGVKPLYYYKDSHYFAFASEIKAMLSLPFITKELVPETIFDFIILGAPNIEDSGFFKNIFELKPSHAFLYNFPDGTFNTWKYYSLYSEEKWYSFNESKSKEYIRDIRELILEGIRLRLRSDVPVGSALSGGIDSSAVVCSISRLIAQEKGIDTHTQGQQKVFTASFPNTQIDETQWAIKAAQHAQAQSFITTPQPDEFLQDIEDIAYTQDTPYGSPSVYAQYRVMKLAHENNVKVLLDGQGADELFTGYTMYYPVLFYQFLKHSDMKGFSREWNHLNNAPIYKNQLRSDLIKQIRRMFIPYSIIRKYRTTPKGPQQLIKKEFWESHKHRFDLIRDRDFSSMNTMLLEFFTRQKLGNLLKYEDRNSMRFSVEARAPFSDFLKLIEYVFRIPPVYKIHNGWSKYLLREAMKDIIPDEIRFRTDKKGFFIPDSLWLTQLKEPLKAYLTTGIDAFIDVPRLLNQWDNRIQNANYDDIRIIWNIISFAVWKKVFHL